MWDKFGEFDSVEELNRAAAAQLAEGDKEAILVIAKENGIDEMDAQDYMSGDEPELATPLMAAVGKIEIESAELKLGGETGSARDMILAMCSDDIAFCHAVRKKGKRLEKCLGEILRAAYEQRMRVDDRIVRAAGLTPGQIHEGLPGKAECRKLIREYYMD